MSGFDLVMWIFLLLFGAIGLLILLAVALALWVGVVRAIKRAKREGKL